MTAYLYCTVLLEEDNSPVEDLTVTCTFEDGTVLTETTDSDGEVTFSWTPLNLGEETVTINCSKQGDYASHTQTVDIRIGLFLSFAGIMTGLTCEDDEYYEGTFETNIEHRSQLATYIKNIYVANGGERCVTQDGLVYIASPGDLVVEYDNLDQDEDYSQVIFEGEVDSLVGAVYGMSVTDNDEIVLTKLERADIVGDGPIVGSVGLTSSSSSVYMKSNVTLTATVLDEDDEPLEDVNVSFLEDGTNKGYSVTNSSGVATFTYSPSSAGVHSLTAKAGGVVSSSVSVTATKAKPAFGSFAVSPSSCLVNDSVTVSGNLAVTPGSPVLVYDGSSVVATLYTGSNYGFSGSVVLSSSGEHSIKAVFVEDDYYQGNETDSVTVTVSKRTATLSLVSSESSVVVDESFTLSGALSVGSGQSVLLYRNGHYVETLTTGTNGAFSKTVTESSAGSYSYYVLFESTSVYSRVQSSTVSVTVSGSTPTVDSVSLSADKSILSYADSQSATLSATVLDDNDDPMEGVSVEVFNGSSSMGTATTNSSGIATKSYASAGVGDVTFTASVGTISSET
jgi:protocatechuate 3,4-dioxygenase beta subunit